VNRTFVQTSRGCHQGCTFCAEPLMNGLKFRYRPVDEVIHEMENCGARTISINDADFFGTPERPKEVMRALRGRGFQWQAGVTSKLAQDDRMLELAAASGCTMLSIGFESISRTTLKSVHKHVNHPETFAALVEKVHSYGSWCSACSCSASMATIARLSTRPSISTLRPNTMPVPIRY